MEVMPNARFTPCRAFKKVRIDYTGPINTKCNHKRKYKSYLYLFVCMKIKAVHLELFLLPILTDVMSTIYSPPRVVYDIFSGNVKCCIIHQRTLYQNSNIEDFVAQYQIHWHFMHPNGPNFGSLWESSIKLAKRHLYKSCQKPYLILRKWQQFYASLKHVLIQDNSLNSQLTLTISLLLFPMTC